jgi:hypothetical protein
MTNGTGINLQGPSGPVMSVVQAENYFFFSTGLPDQ